MQEDSNPPFFANAQVSSNANRTTPSQNTTDPLDPFDPAHLRISQDFEAQLGVKKALVTVPVKKPNRQSFVRVHPDPAYTLTTAILELKEEGENYLVAPSLVPELPTEVSPRTLFTSITRQGSLFIWPVRLPGTDGRQDEWSRSSLEAAKMATTRWVRVASNKSAGYYDIYEATAKIPEPEWPDMPMKKILAIAFKDRYIDNLDHPVLQKLRGQA